MFRSRPTFILLLLLLWVWCCILFHQYKITTFWHESRNIAVISARFVYSFVFFRGETFGLLQTLILSNFSSCLSQILFVFVFFSVQIYRLRLHVRENERQSWLQDGPQLFIRVSDQPKEGELWFNRMSFPLILLEINHLLKQNHSFLRICELVCGILNKLLLLVY